MTSMPLSLDHANSPLKTERISRFPETEGWDRVLALNVKSIFYGMFSLNKRHPNLETSFTQ